MSRFMKENMVGFHAHDKTIISENQFCIQVKCEFGTKAAPLLSKLDLFNSRKTKATAIKVLESCTSKIITRFRDYLQKQQILSVYFCLHICVIFLFLNLFTFYKFPLMFYLSQLQRGYILVVSLMCKVVQTSPYKYYCFMRI